MKDFTATPFYHILCGIFDLVILNLCWIACCLPIVTAGAATAALYRSVYALLREEGNPIRDFFRTLTASLKIGIPLWLLWALALAIALGDFVVVGFFWDFPGKYLVLGILALCAVVLVLLGSCLFPVLSCFSDIKTPLTQSFRLCFRFLPRMIPVCLLNLLPVWIFFCWNYGFLLLSGFFLLIWFSLSAYINTVFLRPLLDAAEEQGF